MNEKPTFDDVRRDLEDRQKSILWEDALKGGRSVDAFLWKGDPKAKPVQRAGLVVFGLSFLLIAVVGFVVGFASSPFGRRYDETWVIPLVLGGACLFISLRLFRNAFLRGPAGDQEDRERRR